MKQTLILLTGICFSINLFSQESLVDANNNFAFKIYKAAKPDSNNFFISPFSLNIALAIASEGAAGSTKKEIDSLLCISDIVNQSHAYESLIEKSIDLKDASYDICKLNMGNELAENQLWIANSMWIQDKLNLEKDYKSIVNSNYHSEFFHFNLGSLDKTNLKLKEWISEKTNENIKDISRLDSGTMLSIVNAIYFMGEWGLPFNENLTEEDVFYTFSQQEVHKKFMHQQTTLKYYSDSKVKCVYIPYLCDQFSMLIILPNKKYGILNVEEHVNKAYYDKIAKQSEPHEVILSLPKFKIETELKPKTQIMNMGYTEMFSSSANFTKMSRAGGIMIGDITHKTFIELDEKKTEAAAVTKIDIISYGAPKSSPPKPKEFIADHPFIFLIVDNRTNAILFTGRYVN